MQQGDGKGETQRAQSGAPVMKAEASTARDPQRPALLHEAVLGVTLLHLLIFPALSFFSPHYVL